MGILRFIQNLSRQKEMIVKSDPEAQTVKIDYITHIVRVDGIILCKRIVREGVVFLQFKDGDRMRSHQRGTAFVEVPLEAFNTVLLAAFVEDALKTPT
jgi:hypothetical protein